MLLRALPLALNCSILFSELALLERPAAAKAAGFDAVEFWWPFSSAAPRDGEVDAFVNSVESAGVDLIALNFAAGDMPAGDRGLTSWTGRESEFRDSVQVAVGIAGRLGTRAFNALYGNRLESVSDQQQDELAAENLAWAAQQVAAVEGIVLLEPVSGAPRYPLRTAADVVAVIDRVAVHGGAVNLKLLADLYHLSVNGDDVPAALRAHVDRIGHVQIADAPGRHEPGTGELDLQGYIDDLVAGGYRGRFALEYTPSTTTAAGLAALDLGSSGR